ncbi:MAG TPA: homoserine dehydrogenase [Bacillota bacterium]|nr:homoserine dehydrogenase [Bacillota bacterium]
MEKISIAILGLGTVGSGVVQRFYHHQQKIEKRLHKKVEIQNILVKEMMKRRDIDIPDISSLLTDSFKDVMAKRPNVMIESLAGAYPAYEYVKWAIEQGCHVITANKAMIAKHGAELQQLANRQGVKIFFEASVGAAIPIIQTLRNNLQCNDIQSIHGIVNGTTNYILTSMLDEGASFEQVLQEAQLKGYAEADPTADICGYDTLYKLAILTKLAFGVEPELEKVYRVGIETVTAEELKQAHELGYKIKLLASVELEDHHTIRLEVSPKLIANDHPLASINGVLNAIAVTGDMAGELTFVGAGAGSLPTASAILEDLVSLYTLSSSIQDHDQKEFIQISYDRKPSSYQWLNGKIVPAEEVEKYKLSVEGKGEIPIIRDIIGCRL